MLKDIQLLNEKLKPFLEFLSGGESFSADGLNNAVIQRVSGLVDLTILTLKDISQSVNNKIPLSTSRKYIKLCREILNLLNKQPDFKEYSNKFKESIKLVSQYTEKENVAHDEISSYFYSQKTKNAFLVGEKDNQQSIKNVDNMKTALVNCGYNCFVADDLQDFKKYLEDNFVLGDNFVDFIFYYSGQSVSIDSHGELLFDKEKEDSKFKNLTGITSCLKEKENNIKNNQFDILKDSFIKVNGLGGKDFDYSLLFKIEFKKLFIFDIFQDKPLSEMIKLNQPIFKENDNNKDTIYFYSNTPNELNSFYDTPSTIFTNSIVGRINSDVSKNKGRNLSSIAKIVQFNVIDKLNIFKSTFDPIEQQPLQQQQSSSTTPLSNKESSSTSDATKTEQSIIEEGKKQFIKSEREILTNSFGTEVNELSFGRFLLNWLPIIFGDASNNNFLIFGKN